MQFQVKRAAMRVLIAESGLGKMEHWAWDLASRLGCMGTLERGGDGVMSLRFGGQAEML